jgi:hypothetical protein
MARSRHLLQLLVERFGIRAEDIVPGAYADLIGAGLQR